MIIQGLNSLSGSHATPHRALSTAQRLPDTAANTAGRVSISEAARALLAGTTSTPGTGSTQEVDRQLAAIKAKPGVERTQADTAYLQAHDERLLTLQEKIRTSGNASLTSDEVDYMQKAGGFVNTMAYLSNSEKALYDKMVSEGQGEAAQALHLVGMSRIGMSGQQITLPDGQHFDPTRTQVSAASLRNLFSHLFVDPGGQTDRQFEALATYLDQQATSQPQG